MQTVEYWEVTETSNWKTRTIGAFANEELARNVAGVGKGRAWFHRSFPIYDNQNDFDADEKRKLYEAALAKLSIEERTVLGIM